MAVNFKSYMRHPLLCKQTNINRRWCYQNPSTNPSTNITDVEQVVTPSNDPIELVLPHDSDCIRASGKGKVR
jgi:hypothetical protein